MGKIFTNHNLIKDMYPEYINNSYNLIIKMNNPILRWAKI